MTVAAPLADEPIAIQRMASGWGMLPRKSPLHYCCHLDYYESQHRRRTFPRTRKCSAATICLVGRFTSSSLGRNMAEKKESPEGRLMQGKIFNKVCMAYRRSHEAPTFAIRADELRKGLSIPEDIFSEVLYAFIHTENQMAVEVFQ